MSDGSAHHQDRRANANSTAASARAMHSIVARALLLERGGEQTRPHTHPRTRVLQRFSTGGPPPHFSFECGGASPFYQEGVPYGSPYYGGGFGGILPFLGRLLQLIFLWSLLMGLSLASYLAFYHGAMPSTVASERLYFDYSGANTASCAATQAGEDLSSGHLPPAAERPSFGTPCVSPFFHLSQDSGDGSGDPQSSSPFSSKPLAPPSGSSCRHPHATVDLLARHAGAWEAWHESVVPPPRAVHRVLAPRQLYLVEVRLWFPDSPHNRRLGMFPVVAQLTSSNGTVLATSHRSIRYPHRTPWIAAARQAVRLLPLLAGAADESTELSFVPFRHFAEAFELPLRCVRLQLLPSATGSESRHCGMASSSAHLEVIAGQIVISEELSAFQEVLREWYCTCLLVGIHLLAALYLSLWHILQALLGACQNASSSGDVGNDDYDDPPCELDPDGSILEDDAGDDVDDDSSGRAPHTGERGGFDRGEDRSEIVGGRSRGRRRRPPVVVVEDDDGESDDRWEDLRHRRRPDSADGDMNDRSEDDGNGDREDDASFATPPQAVR